MSEILLILIVVILLAAVALLALKLGALAAAVRELPLQQTKLMEDKHRDMLKDLHDGLTRQGDRLSEVLGKTSEQLRGTVEGRLDQISGKVSERLDEGFKKTNETFTSVMTRLATIDEAQKKIDSLTTNMVSLQELLGDKRSRRRKEYVNEPPRWVGYTQKHRRRIDKKSNGCVKFIQQTHENVCCP